MTMKRWIAATSAILIWTGLAVAPASAADKVVLMLNWYVYGEHAPFYYGKGKGIYAAENIDLEIQEGRGSAATTQAVAAKTADFGYVDVPTMMRAAIKGAPVIATGVLLQTSPMSAMGFASKGIAAPKDFVGKTVVLTPGDSFSQIWPVLLRVNNIPEDQIKIISGDAATKRNAVVNGQADLLLGNINDQKPTIEEVTGKPIKAVLFSDFGVNTVNGGLFANNDTLAGKADLVKRFMLASTLAAEVAQKDPAAAVAALLKAAPKAGKVETVTSSWAVTLPLLHTKRTQGERPFRASKEDVAETMDIMAKFGGVEVKAAEVDKYYTGEFLP
jgi:NitT/TauT family transport system substrate-binding protein